MGRGPVVGLVLTGGEARRLGRRPKHALRHPGGDALLTRIHRVMASVASEVWVVGEGPAGMPRLDDPRRGPALAVATAAARFPGVWLLVCPGDLARPSPRLFARLARPGPGDDAITVGARGLWAQMVLGVAADFARSRTEGGFQGWWAEARRRRVPLGALGSSERAGLLDVDTPAQARRLRVG